MAIVGRVWLCMQGNGYFMVRFLSANARILDDGPGDYDKCVVLLLLAMYGGSLFDIN